jgi:hypothetical protein
MTQEKQKAFLLDFPNHGAVLGQLSGEDMKYLWKAIKKGKKDNLKMNHSLAGNITTSLAIKDKDNRIFAYVKAVIQEYEKKFGRPYYTRLTQQGSGKDHVYTLSLDSFWVNFQRQNEFNPLHNHSGAYSFVIWMKIPTEWEDQKELPIAKNSGDSRAISSFILSYTDILGGIKTLTFQMNKEREGQLLLFPSQIYHLVNPFYNCDEERVSISGNIYLDIKEKVKNKWT